MNFKSISKIVLFLLLSIPLSIQPKIGEQVKFTNLSIDDGLSQVSVYCILQDHRGFMWFGTRDGLNKFDGYDFIVYQHQPHDSTSITHNKINTLVEDHKGIIWIGTDNGINIYNRELDCFQEFINDSVNSNVLSLRIIISRSSSS